MSVKSSVVAVVVTFHPDESVPDALVHILDQVDHLVVVDNGSPEAKLARVQKALAGKRATILALPSNTGIGSALNRGIEAALPLSPAWIILLDQDSELTENFIATMVEEAESPGLPLDQTLFTPVHLSRRSGLPMGVFLLPDGEPLAAITSGTLLSPQLYAAQGPFREELIIDMVDDEYCLRLRRSGGSVHRVQKAQLLHEVGSPSMYTILGVTFKSLDHSAKRRYFIVRNRLLVLGQYGFDYPAYTLTMLYATLNETVKIALIPKNRAEKLRLTARAVFDAIRGRTGNRVNL